MKAAGIAVAVLAVVALAVFYMRERERRLRLALASEPLPAPAPLVPWYGPLDARIASAAWARPTVDLGSFRAVDPANPFRIGLYRP